MDSSRIINLMYTHYPAYARGLLKKRDKLIGKKKDGTEVKRSEQYIIWDRNTTLEQWIAWTAGTLRWRIKYELEARRILEIGMTHDDVKTAKQGCELCLIAAEKFLGQTERQRLIAI